MQHFFGIFTPARDARGTRHEQKPFFGPEWRLSRGERDAALLSGRLDSAADEPREAIDRPPRFVTLLAPPFL